MKTLILYLLLCVSGLAADSGVHLVSTVTTTNTMGQVSKETFTRGGQINLVRWRMLESGIVVSMTHEFYHHGDLIAIIQGAPNPVSFEPKPGLPYQLSLNFWPSKDARCLHINGKDFNELFYATNGVFYPAPDSDLGIKDYKK